MGKFELAPANQSPTGANQKKRSSTPLPTVRSNRGATAASTANGLDFARRARSVLRFEWTSSGRKGCLVNLVDSIRFFLRIGRLATVRATVAEAVPEP